MSLWHYIMEFFLFRWLSGTYICGKDRNDKPGRDVIDDAGFYAYKGNRHGEEHGHSPYHDNWQSDDDFLEEQEDYDMMDDF